MQTYKSTKELANKLLLVADSERSSFSGLSTFAAHKKCVTFKVEGTTVREAFEDCVIVRAYDVFVRLALTAEGHVCAPVVQIQQVGYFTLNADSSEHKTEGKEDDLDSYNYQMEHQSARFARIAGQLWFKVK